MVVISMVVEGEYKPEMSQQVASAFPRPVLIFGDD
jgi:hypothetical protein